MTTEVTVNNDPFVEMMREFMKAPNMNVEVMNKMLDIKERMMDKEAEQAFNEARIEMRKDLPKIGKNKSNSQTSSRYVDLEKIKDAVDPILAKHGFDIHYENDFPADRVAVTAILTHIKGHTQRNRVELPLDNMGMKGNQSKTAVHGVASSITYAERYALCGLLGINTGDTDGNSINQAKEKINDDQVKVLKDLIKETKSDEKLFLAYVAAPTLGDILAKDYKRALASLNAKLNPVQK